MEERRGMCHSEEKMFTRQHILALQITSRLGHVYTFRFSTGRRVPIIAGQSSGILGSIGLFTQPRRLAGRLPDLSNTMPVRMPVAEST